ncbi:hypothetical protein [Aestuariivivens insulae]|uniref:hypothetical protein n=1 Tax=Aestuariivivens insulae TaxID=1621988 RepID=UPI001F56E7E5|nr:hypothetical protein [Aestuariivivens insulae]
MKLLLLALMVFTFLNCSSDGNDCPDIIEINLNDPESIKQAEDCGLAPAEPLGTVWVSERYRQQLELETLKVD